MLYYYFIGELYVLIHYVSFYINNINLRGKVLQYKMHTKKGTEMKVAINNKKGEKFKQVKGRIKNCDVSDEDIYEGDEGQQL